MDQTKDSLLRGTHPVPPALSPCPLLPSSPARVLPRGPYSVLRSSGISSVGCQRLRTWCLGLPLVHHQPSGVSGFTQPDIHLGLCEKCVAVLPRLPTQSTGTLAECRFSPTSSFPHTHGPTGIQPRVSPIFLVMKNRLLSRLLWVGGIPCLHQFRLYRFLRCKIYIEY